MRHTAVEWLKEHYYLEIRVNGEIHIDLLNKLFEQAKEMEKEQMEKTWVAGLYCETGDRQAFIDYYNETFKSE